MTKQLFCTLGTALLVTALAPGAWAQGPVPEDGREARFGTIGLARLQTARLSVLNHDPRGTQPPDPYRPACRVRLGFVDSDGMAFLNPAGSAIADEVAVGIGGLTWLDLTSADAFRNRLDNRVQIRPTVEFAPTPNDGSDPLTPTPNDGSPDPCAFAMPVLEIVDSTIARTALATPLEFTERGEPVDYDRLLLFGAPGLTRGQILRVNVTNLGALQTCQVKISANTIQTLSSRAPVAVTRIVDLAPSTSVSIDLPWTTVFSGLTGLRVPVTASVILPPPSADDACGAIASTLEIFDALTGRTQVYLSPHLIKAPRLR
jgi:hypothetical protein